MRSIKANRAIIFCLISTILLLLSCSKDIPINPVSPEQNRLKKIIQEQGKSVVFIGMYDKKGNPLSYGSGFFISKDGKIITNYHVIENGYRAIIKTLNGKTYDHVFLLSFDEKKDIALLEVNENNAPPVKIGDSDFVEQGDKVITIGNPEGFQNTVSEGIISGIREYEEIKFFQFSSPISHGNSGGPLYNLNGEVVGIATLMSKTGQNLNFAVPINYIVPLKQDQKRLLLEKRYLENQKKKLTAKFLEKLKQSSELEPEQTLSKEAFELYKKVEASTNSFYILGTENLTSIQLLEQAIQVDPYYHAAYYMLGLSYSNRKNYSVAEKYFLQSIELKHRHQEAYTELAYIYKKQNLFDKALEYYNKSLNTGPSNGSILSNIGEIYLNKGNLEKAESYYKKTLNQKDKRFYLDEIAYFYLKTGRLKKSWNYLKDSFNLFPDDATLKTKIDLYKKYLDKNNFYALASVGFIYYSLDKYKEAIEYFEKALKFNKSEFDQYYKLGMSYKKTYNYKKAILYLEEAIANNPNHYGANLNLGLIYNLDSYNEKIYNIKTDRKRAIELFNKAKEINPKRKDPYYNLGKAYMKTGLYDDALISARSALEIKSDKLVFELIGDIYYAMNDYTMSLSNYKKSLELEDNASTRYSLADTLIQLKEYDEAETFLKESINTHPWYPFFKSRLGDVYYEKGKYLLAIQHYNDCLKKYPDDFSSHFGMAQCYFSLEQWDKSERWLKKVIKINPVSYAAFYNLGLVYVNKDQYEKAKSNFIKALDIDPNDIDAKKRIEYCQYQIDSKKFPEKLQKLSYRNDNVGKLAKLFLYTYTYSKANDLWIEGLNKTEYKDGKNIVSSKIFEAQGHFEKIKNDLNKIGPVKGKTKNILDLFVFAVEQRIKGIEQHSEGFYANTTDYKGQYEKGRAKIKLADTYFADGLKLLYNEVNNNILHFGTIALKDLEYYIKYYQEK